MSAARIVTIAGGVGAAKFLNGLVRVVEPTSVTAVVNIGDDIVLHGLHISPDLDTVTYTLAGEINPETGWGLRHESWQAMDMVRHYGGESWFGLGDRDLGTHLYRTQRLAEGARLSEVTAEITSAWELGVHLTPASDDRVETRVTLAVDDLEVNFQEYFVRHRHDVAISAVRFVDADRATPATGVLEAINDADAIIIAPSNPLVSIAPVMAIPGIREAICARRDVVAAVSPIIAGAALKGPADRMLSELGHDPDVVGVARLYRDLASILVLDEADRGRSAEVADLGIEPVVTDTIMSTPQVAARLADTVLTAIRGS